MKPEIFILLLEDNPMDVELIRALLQRRGIQANIQEASSEDEFRKALRGSTHDIIISDFSLPSYNGHSALMLAQEIVPQTPFIFYSGTIGEESAIEALKRGATDYVLKQRPERLISAIERALDEMEEKRRRKEAEEQIAAQAQLLDLASDAIIVRDLDGRVQFWNAGAERLYGYARREVEGKRLELVSPAFGSVIDEAKRLTLENGQWNGELEYLSRDQKRILASSRWTLVRDEAGRPDRILSIDADITERRMLQAQLLRAQRLESVGTLASGIAHDLNNILSPIFMASELLQQEPLTEDGGAMVQTIQQSAQRGAEIVRQILTFVRGSEGKRTSVNLVDVLNEVCEVVRKTFPKNITVNCQLDGFPKIVRGDATHLHQVFMNLCVNARDAMPSGGELTVRIDSTEEKWNANAMFVVSVRDTGTGIPAGILDQIFDPFFTTKETGKGTGLGLSTVLGIVKAHEGTVTVDSIPGSGTLFKVALPAERQDRKPDVSAGRRLTRKGKGELILLVDDEAEIRRVAGLSLIHNGYEVVTAHDGASALIEFARNAGRIQLVITDVMMPGLDGPTLVKRVLAASPNTRILITSGLVSQFELPSRSRVLSKPFSGEELLRAVDELLHGTE